MKEYYGNYLGICINNDDPQKRGRVQVFIPHIMPALYEYWNKEGNDIKISCVGDNVEGGLSSDVIEELRKILPWAESASPILGSSSPGVLTTATLQAVAAAATGGLTTLASKAIDAGRKLIFNQSPVAAPPVADQSTNELGANASKFGPLSPDQLNSVGQYSHKCGQGARQILGAMTNNPYFSQGLSAGSGGSSSAGSLSKGNDYLQKSGLYQTPSPVPANYTPQKGDVITGTKAGGPGHIQVYDGSVWRSDTIQPNGYLANYGDLTLHRMNDKGLGTVGTGSQQNSSGSSVPNEQQSQSGTLAAISPLQGDSLDEDPDSPLYGSIADPEQKQESAANKDTTLQANPNGTVDPNKMQSYVESQIANSKLNGYVPKDGAKYGIDGTPKSWANYFVNLSNRESSLSVNTVGDVGKFSGNSNGLFQLSPGDAVNYGLNGGQPFTQQQLSDPMTNTNAAIAITEKLVLKDGAIGSDSTTGAAKYWGPLRRGWTPPTNPDYSSIVAEQNAKKNPSTDSFKLHNKTDPHGPTAVVDINNMAKGVFSYPAPGALLWVFFQEGNPLFPVYFAANYGPNEWQSAYRYGSPGPGYKPEGTSDDPSTSTGGIMNLNGVGGLRWENTDSPNDPTQSQKSIALFGEDGSNMFIGTGYHQIFSKFDRRDQVEGDRFQTTLGYKEEWVQGDDSKTVMGDVIVRIGNVSKPAVDAVTRIQELIKDSMKPVTEPSN